MYKLMKAIYNELSSFEGNILKYDTLQYKGI